MVWKNVATAANASILARPLVSIPKGANVPGQLRLASVKASPAPSKADAKQLAAQRERIAARDQARKVEQKKMQRLLVQARNSTATPLCMDVVQALRFLRAAEVGRAPETTTISLSIRIVAERGTALIAGGCRLPKPLADVRVAVFTSQPELQEEAKRAGATVVGGEELIEEVKNGRHDFEKAFASPEMVQKLGQVARILGPKGLMPSAKKGTVTTDIYDIVSSSSGEMPYKQKGPVLALPVGRASFTDVEVLRNLVAAVQSIKQSASKIQAKKPIVLGQAVISSTTGPGIVIAI